MMRKLNLWTIKTPYDYHRMSTVVVLAEDAEKATQLAKEYLIAKNPWNLSELLQFLKENKPQRHASDVYFNSGCDC